MNEQLTTLVSSKTFHSKVSPRPIGTAYYVKVKKVMYVSMYHTHGDHIISAPSGALLTLEYPLDFNYSTKFVSAGLPRLVHIANKGPIFQYKLQATGLPNISPIQVFQRYPTVARKTDPQVLPTSFPSATATTLQPSAGMTAFMPPSWIPVTVMPPRSTSTPSERCVRLAISTMLSHIIKQGVATTVQMSNQQET